VFDRSERGHDEPECDLAGVEAIGPIDDEPHPSIQSLVPGLCKAHTNASSRANSFTWFITDTTTRCSPATSSGSRPAFVLPLGVRQTGAGNQAERCSKDCRSSPGRRGRCARIASCYFSETNGPIRVGKWFVLCDPRPT